MAAGIVRARLGRGRNGATSQLQELQDILDQESQRVAHIKASYTQQNIAIARENSLLKVKLSEMESKVSELIQENVSVRSQLAVTQLNYKEQLNNRLAELENQLLMRFQSILDMFQEVRGQENLPSSSKKLNSSLPLPLQMPLPPSSLPSSKDSQLSSTSSPVSVNSTSSRKRRKSSRRQSMFVPSDFEFPSDDEKITVEEEVTNSNIDMHNVSHDDSDFTNSIIDYSIPEENDTKQYNYNQKQQQHKKIMSSSYQNSNSSSKLEIYKDDDNDNDNININKNTDKTNENDSVKHSINPPRIKSKKRKIVDEIMPITTYPEIQPQERKTRGKTVNYTLPSLRAKMRRPTEKLVDATTTINIKDLQVNNRRKSNIIAKKNSILQDITNQKSSSPLMEKSANKGRPLSQKKKLFKHAIINDFNDDDMPNDSGNSSIVTTKGKSVSFRLSDEDLSVFDLIPSKTIAPKTYKNNSNTSLKSRVLNL